MDAPKGRYRVIEKDGRLIVIDNETGEPASTSTPPPRSRDSSPVSTARSGFQAFADFLLGIAVTGYDEQGRAVIHWTWKEKGRERRWDAWLDSGEQRRMGRALAAIALAPLLVFIFAMASGLFLWLGIALTMGPILWGISVIMRLRAETDGRLPPA